MTPTHPYSAVRVSSNVAPSLPPRRERLRRRAPPPSSTILRNHPECLYPSASLRPHSLLEDLPPSLFVLFCFPLENPRAPRHPYYFFTVGSSAPRLILPFKNGKPPPGRRTPSVVRHPLLFLPPSSRGFVLFSTWLTRVKRRSGGGRENRGGNFCFFSFTPVFSLKAIGTKIIDLTVELRLFYREKYFF